MYTGFVKPVFDRLSALIVLIVTLPILLGALVSLLIANRGKVWFIQERPGKDGKIFKIIKFKTMNDATDSHGNMLQDDKRLTWLGKFIRKASIDELPQLLNVLKGDMSIVGPRPLLPEYLALYDEQQEKRHRVRPGITGWAQVNGRNSISWQEKFTLDTWYVEHVSFALDIKILFLTVAKVLKAEGISGQSTQTMEKFRGNK